MTEQEAYKLMKDGDRDAMAWIYENNRNQIARFFMSAPFKCTQKEARDIALDAVMKLGESLEKGKMPILKVQLLTLLIGIAKKMYAAAKRKAHLPYVNWDPLEISDDEDNSLFDEDFQDRLEMEEILDKLEPTVHTMGDPCQTILTEYYWNDKTDKEIGIIIGKTKDAIKMKRKSCIETLRKHFFNH
jgi:RNA polymerase sigma factor (sigma-70 family)